jgi:hypothetical protein
MTETNKARDLVATLRDALHQLEADLPLKKALEFPILSNISNS